MSRDGKGASASQTGLSPSVEPASSLDGFATSIPCALRAISEGIENYVANVMPRPNQGITNEGIARQVLLALVVAMWSAASRIEARSDETPQAAQPEGREPDPKGDAQP